MVGRKKQTKQRLIFLAAALAVCLTASLLLTEAGLGALYPFAVRTQIEELQPSGNSYNAYFELRSQTASAEVIAVSIDSEIAQSYDVMGHFFRFAKQYSDIGTVLLPVSEEEASVINDFWQTEVSAIQGKKAELLASFPEFSVDFVDFLSELAYVNATVTPQRKFTAVAVSGGVTDVQQIKDAMDGSIREGQTCFVLADAVVVENGEFETALDGMLGDTLMLVKVRYSGGEYKGASSLSLPFMGDISKCCYVTGASMDGFNSYANSILNFFCDGKNTDYGEKISGVGGEGFFFVISHGTPVIYEKSEERT